MTWIWDFYRSNPQIVWEIFKFIRPRELAFVPTRRLAKAGQRAHRHINCGRIGVLWRKLKWHYGYKEGWHLFGSLQYVVKTLYGRPVSLREFWLTWGFDVTLDLDAKEEKGLTLEDAWHDALAIAEFYDEWSLPYYVVFSGRRGFHVTVPWRYPYGQETGTPYLEAHFAPEDFTDVGRAWTALVMERLGPRTLEAHTTYKVKGLIRAPWSIHPVSGLVALPLRPEDLRDFDPHDPYVARPEVAARMDAQARGLCLRNEGLRGAEGLLEFVEEALRPAMRRVLGI